MDDWPTAETARIGYDLGNLAFANAWVAFGGFALPAGWVLSTSQRRHRWLGWWGVAAGVALIAVRVMWTSDVWVFACVLFWLWVGAFAVVTLRTRPSSAVPATRHVSDGLALR